MPIETWPCRNPFYSYDSPKHENGLVRNKFENGVIIEKLSQSKHFPRLTLRNKHERVSQNSPSNDQKLH